MKYILIAHGDSGDPADVTICDTEDQRDRATIKALFGNEVLDGDEVESWLKYRDELRSDGWARFEGDPPLQWVRAGVSRIEVATEF